MRKTPTACSPPASSTFDPPAQVVERLRADPGLDAARLGIAARLARLVSAAPHRADMEAWRVLRVPGEPDEDVHVALWSARIAARSRPAEARSQLLLGAALYRLGRWSEALAALERADALRTGRGEVDVLAFLAMAAIAWASAPAPRAPWPSSTR